MNKNNNNNNKINKNKNMNKNNNNKINKNKNMDKNNNNHNNKNMDKNNNNNHNNNKNKNKTTTTRTRTRTTTAATTTTRTTTVVKTAKMLRKLASLEVCKVKKDMDQTYNRIDQTNHNSSTAQGGGGSFKDMKVIGEVGCCDARKAERTHWRTERWLTCWSGCSGHPTHNRWM